MLSFDFMDFVNGAFWSQQQANKLKVTSKFLPIHSKIIDTERQIFLKMSVCGELLKQPFLEIINVKHIWLLLWNIFGCCAAARSFAIKKHMNFSLEAEISECCLL